MRLFSSRRVILIWSGFVLLFLTAQIGIFKITSRVEHKTSPFNTLRKRTALKSLLEAQVIPEATANNSCDELFTCHIPLDPVFPLCEFKIKEFNSKWNQRCHGDKFEVDPKNICSVIQYLSEKEAWCPVLPWRQHQSPFADSMKRQMEKKANAVIQTNLLALLDKFKGGRFAWIRKRLMGTWPHWLQAIEKLQLRHSEKKRKRKKILIYPSSLGEHEFFLDSAFMGGPLGELAQWCDLISALYILGHDLIVGFKTEDIPSTLIQPAPDGCVREKLTDGLDLIFTDIMGVLVIAHRSGADYSLHKCKLRVLDSFGTDAEFNYKHYKEKIPGERSIWGDLDLFLPQFMTMFPHSPDNSFLGFAVPQRKRENTATTTKNVALVYGKDPEFWKGYGDYIDTVKKHFSEVHATLGFTRERRNNNGVPDYVINHGIVNITQLIDLLRSSKVFVGLGQPYEGPAALEALANGCFFLNPKYNPPLDRTNAGFFAGKPFSRKITSQNPYAEVFVGKPFVQTVDIHNLTEVEDALKEIMNTENEPHLPYEYTHVGMLERVSAYVEHQDFCRPSSWPPMNELKMIVGGEGESCLEACHKKQLTCEPKYFVSLNTKETLQRANFQCKSTETLESLVAPALNTTNSACLLQSQPLLFSCRAARPSVRRICPCRSYRSEQVALCESC